MLRRTKKNCPRYRQVSHIAKYYHYSQVRLLYYVRSDSPFATGLRPGLQRYYVPTCSILGGAPAESRIHRSYIFYALLGVGDNKKSKKPKKLRQLETA